MGEVLKIFISATSADLSAVRRAARDFFNRQDHYKAREQQHRSSVPATLLANDRHHLADCDAVLHIVGECYGQEPRALDGARRSYTQREFDYAIAHQKPLYIFVCEDGFPYKKHQPESQVKQDLQRAHREAILTGDHKYQLIADLTGLDRCLREIELPAQLIDKQLGRTRKRDALVGRQLGDLAGKVTAADPLQRYYKALRQQFANHDSVSLPVSALEREDEKEADIKIRDLFVPPRAAPEYCSPAAVDLAVTAGQTLGEPLLPLLQAPGRRVVLLADPGMGKSTVIQFLIATLIDEQPPAGASGLRGAVPFPFILRLLARDLPADVSLWNWDALLKAFRQWNPGADADGPLAAPLTSDGPLWRGLLNGDRAFFLIDGLDEIGDETRRLAIRAALWEGFARHPEARWLITSRLVGYEQAQVHVRVEFMGVAGEDPRNAEPMLACPETDLSPGERRPGSEVFSIRGPVIGHPMAKRLYLVPFDDTQQRAFAKHWYVARMNAVTGAQRGEEFVAAVHQHPHTRVIGRIPNLLHLLALLYRYRKSLPHGRALIYGAISEAYLHSIPDYRKLIQAGTAFAREFTDKEKLLAIVGMKMHEQLASRKKEDGDREILVDRAQLAEWIGAHFASAQELSEFLDHVARHSGLLLPRGEDRYGFAHLSFQEYYAACQLQQDFLRISSAKIQAGRGFLRRPAAAAELADEPIFAGYAALPVWHEPLLFLVEKLRADEHATTRLIEWMFPQFPDDPTKGRKWMPFSAARLLATLSIDPEVALHDDQRAELWQRLWQAHCAAYTTGWNIAPSLVVAGSTFQPGVLRAAVACKLEQLHFYACSALSDLSPLAGLTGSQMLNFQGCTGLSDLSPLAGLTGLQTLVLYGCTGLGALTPLAGLAGLQTLNLGGCTGLGDLTPLAGLTGLQSLSLNDCTGLGDFTPLAGLTGLQSLVLGGCTGLGDLTPLAGLTGLKRLSLERCSALRKEEIEKLRQALPETEILR